jgi:hypothetical protein
MTTMSLAPINSRDFTAVVPDGPVNRHCQIVLYFDTESGAIVGEPALDVARHEAKDRVGNLPAEQLVGATVADAGELDALREQVKELQARLTERTDTKEGATDA